MAELNMDAFASGDMGDFFSDASEEEQKDFIAVDDEDEKLLGLIPDEDEEEDDEEKEKKVVDKSTADEDDNEDESKKKGGGSQNIDSSKYYSALITTLSEPLPYIKPGDEDKITDVDSFTKFMEDRIEEEVSRRELQDLNDIQKSYLTSLQAGVPHEVIKQSLEIDSNLNSISDAQIEENSELRESLMLNAYLDSGIPEDRAKRFVQLSIKNGTEVEDAKDSLKQLKESLATKTENLRKEALEAKRKDQEKRQKAMQDLRKNIDQPEAVLGEKNLTKKYKNELYELITTPVESNGKSVDFLNKFIQDNPVNSRIILGHLYLMTEGFKPEKMGNVNAKKVRSKANEELHKLITGSGDAFVFGNSKEDDSFSKDLEGDFDFRDTKLF